MEKGTAMSLDFKKILCPVDRSEFSLQALRLAVKITESSDAMLTVKPKSAT